MMVLRHTPAPAGVVWIAGLVAIAGFVVAQALMGEGDAYEYWGGVLLAPLIIAVTVPMIARSAQGERKLFYLLAGALAIKLIGSIARYFVFIDLYHSAGDAAFYNEAGHEVSELLRSGEFDAALRHAVEFRYTGEVSLLAVTDTRFIRFLTGIIYTITGPSVVAGFLVYAWLGFIGLLLILRAYRIAVPEGRHLGYAAWLFLLPSLVFWPASIGKEAWMLLSLGIAALGIAHVMRDRLLMGAALVAAGFLIGAPLRLHVVGLAAAALTAAYLVKPSSKRFGWMGPASKMAAAVLIGLGVIVVVYYGNVILAATGFESVDDFLKTLELIGQRTSQGGSAFDPVVPTTPARVPLAIWTVLFRPHPWEASGPLVLAAALETTALLGLAIVRARWALAAVAAIRRRPFLAFALFFTIVFCLGFATFGNFGLLSRQRVQMYPFFLMLFFLPPRKKREAADVDP